MISIEAVYIREGYEHPQSSLLGIDSRISLKICIWAPFVASPGIAAEIDHAQAIAALYLGQPLALCSTNWTIPLFAVVMAFSHLHFVRCGLEVVTPLADGASDTATAAFGAFAGARLRSFHI